MSDAVTSFVPTYVNNNQGTLSDSDLDNARFDQD